MHTHWSSNRWLMDEEEMWQSRSTLSRLQTTMGGCLTRHPSSTMFSGNKIGHTSSSTLSNANSPCQQTSSAAALDARNMSVTSLFKTTSGSSQVRKPSYCLHENIRQAFLDDTLNPDPRCPLDARQLYTLTKSWKSISRNLSVTAINIFVR